MLDSGYVAMRNNKSMIIILVTVLTLVYGQSFTWAVGKNRLRAYDLPILVQQDAGDSQQSPPEVKPDPAPSDKKTKPPKEPAASDPLKPFTPSEEIKVDQAVDFPYDI